jgi:hypothetical protein
MTCDDIIKLALEAGFCKDSNGIYSRRAVTPDSDLLPSLERFAALVAAHEREACAKVCDELRDEDGFEPYGTECAAAIRARGEP